MASAVARASFESYWSIEWMMERMERDVEGDSGGEKSERRSDPAGAKREMDTGVERGVWRAPELGRHIGPTGGEGVSVKDCALRVVRKSALSQSGCGMPVLPRCLEATGKSTPYLRMRSRMHASLGRSLWEARGPCGWPW